MIAESLYLQCDSNGNRYVLLEEIIRSAKQEDFYGASNIVLPCPGSSVIFHLSEDLVIISKSSI